MIPAQRRGYLGTSLVGHFGHWREMHMGFLSKLFVREPKETKLLGARIVTDEDHRYFVSFSKYHPQVHEPEYVRLVLHYYAKILFSFDPSDCRTSESAFVLQQMIQSLLGKGIRKDSNILLDANIENVAMVVSSPPGNVPREILATLSFDDSNQRYITTHMPKSVNAQHMVFSVAALIQGTIIKLDQRWVVVLSDALFNMNKAYDSGQSYSKAQNLAAIPAGAYLAAMRSRSQQASQGQDTIFPEPPLLVKNAS
jgi:hypothetical protein